MNESNEVIYTSLQLVLDRLFAATGSFIYIFPISIVKEANVSQDNRKKGWVDMEWKALLDHWSHFPIKTKHWQYVGGLLV